MLSYRNGLFGVSFLAITIYLWFANASSTPRHLILNGAGHFLTQNQFATNVQWIKIKEKTFVSSKAIGLSKFDLKYDENSPQWKAEESFLVELQIALPQVTTKFSDCRASNRIHCGWLTISCFGGDSMGNQLSDYTREGRKILTYTYDPIKSSICTEKRHPL